MTDEDFLNSVMVQELDTIPDELIDEFESQFGSLLDPKEIDDFWGSSDFTPL